MFAKLVFDADSEFWNEFDLPALSGLQLQTLARLWACPHSGAKEKLVIRVLATRQVRIKLAPFSDDLVGIEALKSSFRKEALKHMARECGLWRSGNKKALAGVLINWRAAARVKGRLVLNQLLEQSRSQPQQMRFKLAA